MSLNRTLSMNYPKNENVKNDFGLKKLIFLSNKIRPGGQNELTVFMTIHEYVTLSMSLAILYQSGTYDQSNGPIKMWSSKL